MTASSSPASPGAIPAVPGAAEVPPLSIIVVSFNTCALTLKAIETAIAHTACPAEIIVIDNGSNDGSAEQIEAAFPAVRLIRSTENLGFAGANNAAAHYAQGEYLLLLNPDTETRPGAIDALMEFASKRPEAGIWGGRTLFEDGSENPTSCWNRQTLRGLLLQAAGLSSLARASSLLNAERVHGVGEASELEVDIVSGCFLLIKRALFERLGGFDPKFFMYGEDADLCLRAQALGFRPRITRSATIVHHGGRSERIAEDKLVRLLSAKTQLIRRHFRPGIQGLGVTLLTVWPLSRKLAHTMRSTLSRSPEAAESSRVWTDVWARRTEWLDR